MVFGCIEIGFFIAAIVAAGRGTTRRLCAAFFVVCTFIVAWFVPGTPLSRCLFGFLADASLMLVVTIVGMAKDRSSFRERLKCMLGALPSIRGVRVPAVVSSKIIGQILLDLAMFVIAILVLLHASKSVGIIIEVERLLAGMLLIYAGGQFVFDLAHFCFLAKGVSMNLHRTPIAARSLSEFWSQRWNRVVSAWLHKFVFQPLARKGCPRLGILAAFFVSGALHAWPILVAVGLTGAFTTMLFFVLQGVLVLVEHRLRIEEWPVLLARAWTVAILLGSLPLFIDPGLRVFGL